MSLRTHPGLAPILALALLATGPPALSAAIDRGQLVPIRWPDDSQMETGIQEQLRRAQAELQQIIDDPSTSDEELAEAFGSTGQLHLVYSLADSAEASLVNAVLLAPEDFRWIYYLGLFYQEDGQFEKAPEYLQRALALRPEDIPTLLRLGQTLLDANRPGAARQPFEEASRIDSRNAAARYGLGRVAMLEDNPTEAVRLFTEALTEQPEATVIHYPLAMAYRDLGEMDKARAELSLQGKIEVRFDDPLMQQLRSLVQGGSLLVFSATHARAAGDLDAAIRGFRQALQVDPENNATRLTLASTLIQKGDLPAAQKVLEEALLFEPENSSAHYNLAMVLVRREQTAAALPHLQQATSLAPDFVDARLNYGLLLQELERLQESETQFAIATELDPTDPQIRFRHATVLIQLDRVPEAIDQLENALAAEPESVDGQLLMARALGISGRYSDSAASFARVLALDPDNSEALFARALTLLLAEDYSAALAYLESQLQRRPGDRAMTHTLARLLATCPDDSVRDGARGLQLAEEVVAAELTIDHAETMAMALAETGRFGDAESLQRQIIDRAQRSGDAGLLARLRTNLALYQEHQVVRAPWRR